MQRPGRPLTVGRPVCIPASVGRRFGTIAPNRKLVVMALQEISPFHAYLLVARKAVKSAQEASPTLADELLCAEIRHSINTLVNSIEDRPPVKPSQP